MVNSEKVTELGKLVKKLVDGMSRDEKAASWWAWRGNNFVEALKLNAISNSSLIEAMAFACGNIRNTETGFLVKEAFAEKMAEMALSDTDAFDLVMKITALNLEGNHDTPASWRTLAAAALLNQITRPQTRGRSRAEYWKRDVLILHALRGAKQIGLPISHSVGSKNLSGVKLVGAAFKKAGQRMMTEEAIVKVWTNRKKSGLEVEANKLELAAATFQLAEVEAPNGSKQ
ncbi:MAG: hypothetical protein AAFY99_03675 [Pseudomonadota bacterium]